MPALMAGAAEERTARHGRADRAIVDQLARGLVPTAEEGLLPTEPPMSDDALAAAIRAYDDESDRQRERGRRQALREEADRKKAFGAALKKVRSASELVWEYESVEKGPEQPQDARTSDDLAVLAARHIVHAYVEGHRF